jgi:hypothetical protein
LPPNYVDCVDEKTLSGDSYALRGGELYQEVLKKYTINREIRASTCTRKYRIEDREICESTCIE